MKTKLNLKFVVLAIMSFFMASCSVESDENVRLISKNYSESMVIQELKTYNDSIAKSREKMTMRGGIPRWVNVVVSDAVGAYCGGKTGAYIGGKIGLALGSPITGGAFGGFLGAVGFGAYRSAKTHHSTCTYACTPSDFQNNFIQKAAIIIDQYKETLYGNIDFTSVKEDNDNYALDSLSDEVDIDGQILDEVHLTRRQLNVGKIHNIILAALADSMQIGDSEPAMRSVTNDDYMTEEMDFQSFSALMDWNELYEEANQMADGVETGVIESKADYIIILFLNIFSVYTYETKDVVTLINKYATVVNSSNEFTEEEKEYIMYGLATALYSYNYWEVEYLK